VTLRNAQVPFSWAVPGAIGSTTPNAGAFTTLSASGQFTSTVVTGTAPLVIASTTVVANLNASLLLGNTWASPGAIGGTTPGSGAFAALSATGIASFTNAAAATAVGTAGIVGSGGMSLAKGLVMTGPTNAGSGTAGIGIGAAPDGKQMILLSTNTATSGANCTIQFIDTNASGNNWLYGNGVSGTNGHLEAYDLTANKLRFQVRKTGSIVLGRRPLYPPARLTGSFIFRRALAHRPERQRP
jgi:hypothetical protein